MPDDDPIIYSTDPAKMLEARKILVERLRNEKGKTDEQIVTMLVEGRTQAVITGVLARDWAEALGLTRTQFLKLAWKR